MDDATANRIVLVLSIAAALLLAPPGIGTVSALASEAATMDRATAPGVIEAEDYDAGGEGVAYHDVDPANLGGAFYRPADGVDLEDGPGAGSLVVAYMRPTEWLEYTVDVVEAGAYDVTFTVASPRTGTSFRLAVDGTDAGTTVVVPNTGGWDVYADVTKRVTLPSGRWVLRVSTGGYHNLDRMEFTSLAPTPTPVASTPTPTVTTPEPTPLSERVVPGQFEAEGFDLGGEGVGYHDMTPGNSGGAVCRTAEDVDIAALPGGGYAVTGIENGEWLAFTIDGVATKDDTAYPYPVELHLGSDRDGRSVEVEVDGEIVRNVSVPNTGGLGTFAPVLTQFPLTPWGQPEQGRHTIRLLFHGDGQALDKVVFWGRRCSMFADGWADPWFVADRTSGPAPLTVHFTDRSSEWTYGWNWFFGDGAHSHDQHPVHTYLNPGVYTVGLSVNEEDHWIGTNGSFGWFHHLWESRTMTMQVNVSRPVIAVPSGSATPLDGDGDGLCDDVNGNGRKDFADVVLYFSNLDWIASNEPLPAFDYNGNGRVEFADVAWLFNRLETPTARTFTVTAVAIGPGTIQPSGAFTVREGENVTFSLRVGPGVVTPHDTQSGVIIRNYVVVDPVVVPTPQPTSYYGGPYPPQNFVSSYTLSDIRADHTVYGCFYEAGWMTC